MTTDTGVSICKHCGARIVLVNFALGPEWMHQPAGSAFQDDMNQFCVQTKAEPPSCADDTDPPVPPVSTGYDVTFPACPDHHERQHRDMHPPWCDACGWNRGRVARAPQKFGNPRKHRGHSGEGPERNGRYP